MTNILNQGRNEIRLNNSDSKCLLENWVEERAVHTVDNREDAECTRTQGFRHGHPGLLSKQFEATVDNLTTFRDAYRPPVHPGVRQRGRKEELMEQMLYQQISQEVNTEFNAPPEAADFKSTTMADYNKDDFVSITPTPTALHDYKLEQPVTFWSEHKDRVTGVSQAKTRDSAFRRNDAFSKPIGEYWNEPQPYETEDYPKM